MVLLAEIFTVIYKEYSKSFFAVLQTGDENPVVVYFLEVLSQRINALLHSNRPSIQAFYEIVLCRGNDGLF